MARRPAPDHRPLMLEVLKQFRILLRSMDTHYRRVEHRAGLGGAQLWALSEIAVTGGLSMGELAERLGIHLTTSSNLVTRLEELGLVARFRAEGDRRIVRLKATRAGRRKQQISPSPPSGLLQDGLMGMSPRELKLLKKQLAILLDHIKHLDSRAGAVPLAQVLGHPIRGN